MQLSYGISAFIAKFYVWSQQYTVRAKLVPVRALTPVKAETKLSQMYSYE